MSILDDVKRIALFFAPAAILFFVIGWGVVDQGFYRVWWYAGSYYNALLSFIDSYGVIQGVGIWLYDVFR